MKKIKKILLYLLIIFLILIILWRISFVFKYESHTKFGVTFSQKQSQELELDYKQAYLAILQDLNVKNIRLVAYWDLIESTQGQYDFSALDWQMEQAQKNNVKVILAVGQRVPRWPECHLPSWAKQNDREALMKYLSQILMRYKNNSALEMWQVENEPFLKVFGLCEKTDKNLLKDEIAFFKQNDSRPVLVTDSGELASWFRTAKLADYLGTSVYRTVQTKLGPLNYREIIPVAFYRIKAFIILKPIDRIFVSELQAEPWSRSPLIKTSRHVQEETMSLNQFKDNISFTKNLGFSRIYLWGAEWWYYKKINGDSRFWEEANKLFN